MIFGGLGHSCNPSDCLGLTPSLNSRYAVRYRLPKCSALYRTSYTCEPLSITLFFNTEKGAVKHNAGIFLTIVKNIYNRKYICLVEPIFIRQLLFNNYLKWK